MLCITLISKACDITPFSFIFKTSVTIPPVRKQRYIFLEYFILSCGPVTIRTRSCYAPVNLKALYILGIHCQTVVAGKQREKRLQQTFYSFLSPTHSISLEMLERVHSALVQHAHFHHSLGPETITQMLCALFVTLQFQTSSLASEVTCLVAYCNGGG